MPKELKKRGPRGERKARQSQVQGEPPAKRRRTEKPEENFVVTGEAGDDYIGFDHHVGEAADDNSEAVFYGLLTEDEQAYYANVNNKIITNDFEDDQERANFIEAVYRETAGKEIKVASSQSCSRCLERVILLSNANQLRSLFLAFLQDLEYLVQHRFGSHCCETLFIQSAQYVETKSKLTEEGETSFEALFKDAASKLQQTVGYLLTERFASHTIRVLLLILSGLPLEDTSAQQIIASRKKEKIDLANQSGKIYLEPRTVPSGFKQVRHHLVKAAIANLDTTHLRALATSPTGSPVLQLLLRIELSNHDEKGEQAQVVLHRLIPDQQYHPESESSKFVASLVYDATGAYLVQNLVRHLPGRSFKKMYRNLFKDRIGKLAKNEIASYVVANIFERVGKDDLTNAMNAMVPEVPGLVERNRLAIIRVLIERCSARDVDMEPLRRTLKEVYSDDKRRVLNHILRLEPSPNASQDKVSVKTDGQYAPDIQGSLLAQSLLRTEQLSDLVQATLLEQKETDLLNLASNPTSSRVLQAALTSETSSNKFLRQFVPKLLNVLPALAVDSSGSHVVDALWTATKGSHFMKERIASIIAENEQKLRESSYGRTVWKNWSMDIYQRRIRDWTAIAKGFDQQKVRDKDEPTTMKTPLELARERFVQKQGKNRNNSASSTVKAGA